MMRGRRLLLAALVAGLLGASGGFNDARVRAQAIGPLVHVETDRGQFTIMLFREDVPVSAAHVLALVKSGFYDGQRVHRAIHGFVVQFGDPQTRDLSARERWGRGSAASSGSPIGVAEISSKRKHSVLAVGLAHKGEPAQADSQLYITLTPRPDLDGRYAVIGQVVDGTDVPALLQVGDVVRRVYVNE